MAYLQRFAGVGQLPGSPAYTAELPFQTDRKFSECGQFWQCSKPALHQVCNVKVYKCAKQLELPVGDKRGYFAP